jgi:hypothetical protein
VGVDLKLIGTGFGRTGTDSMRDALEMIGFGPCHHMKVIAEDEEQRKLWAKAVVTSEMDWDVLLDGFAACVDWPTAHYWPQLIKAFPKAKVLLTIRDSESWWTSFEKTILTSILRTTGEGRITPGNVMTGPLVFRGQPMTREHCIAVYEENNAKVLAEVSSERLHVQELGAGWDGLCDFLGVDVPDTPFPRSNNPKEFETGWPARL